MRSAMTPAELQLPEELWIQVFRLLSTQDKHSVRVTCRHFKDLLDKSPCLWRGLSVVLSQFSAYNQPFWSSLARRNISSVVVRCGRKKNLKQLGTWLPSVSAVTLENWSQGSVKDLKVFSRLKRLAVISCVGPVEAGGFLLPLSGQLTHLSICNVRLACPVGDFLSMVSGVTQLTSLLFHHDGSQRVPLTAFHALLTGLPRLKHLSWEMITYKTLPEDFFIPAPKNHDATASSHSAGLALSSLELVNYDTVVSQEALQPLSRLRRLSVYHLYSVPGPTCHLRTWLTSLQQLTHLSVHGGHPLGVYADYLPASVTSLTLCVDMTAEDLVTIGRRVPDLHYLHLEPWGTTGHIRLLSQVFPKLRTLRMRHHNVPDSDFLSLHQLQHLETLEVLDPYYWPNQAVLDRVTYQPSPHLLDMIGQLQSLTNNRVQVITSKHSRDPLTCHCI